MGKQKDRGMLPPAVQLFCHRYVLHSNKTKAAEEAYKTLKGKSAEVKAARLLEKPEVLRYILSLQTEINGSKEEAIDMAKKVLEELDIIGFSDIKDYYEPESNEGKYLSKIGKNTRAIESLEVTEDLLGGVLQRKTMKIKLHSKIKGLEWRGKNLKLFTEMIQGVVITKPEVYVPANGRNIPIGGKS
ncbi:MAG: terminase small subunit [Candidatus Paceibacterota bacterium]